jgi:hypothetical protein
MSMVVRTDSRFMMPLWQEFHKYVNGYMPVSRMGLGEGPGQRIGPAILRPVSATH